MVNGHAAVGFLRILCAPETSAVAIGHFSGLEVQEYWQFATSRCSYSRVAQRRCRHRVSGAHCNRSAGHFGPVAGTLAMTPNDGGRCVNLALCGRGYASSHWRSHAFCKGAHYGALRGYDELSYHRVISSLLMTKPASTRERTALDRLLRISNQAHESW